MEYDKLGYTELFSRFDNGFKQALNDNMTERMMEYKEMAREICEVNGVNSPDEVDDIIAGCFDVKRGRCDLRRIKREIFKRRMINGSES